MGGESCTVLRLRLMHKHAMSLNRFNYTNKGRLQLKILVVFTNKTGGEGSGQLLTSL